MAGPKLFFTDTMVASMVLVLASRSLIMTVAQDDAPTLKLGHGCSPANYRYVNESAFQDNLETAFASLASNISSSNASFFATSVTNKSHTDEVYALLLCRKYLTSKQCLECLAEAEKGVKEECSDQGYNGGRIHLYGCLLRYENNSFFEKGTDGGRSTYCPALNNSKSQEFEQTAEKVLSQLTANASGSDGYAVGVASIASTAVYGLAQCAPSLSMATCRECLTAAQSLLVKNCLPKQQGSGLQGTCFIRFAANPFYDNSTSRKDSPTTPSHGNSKTLPILLGSIGGAALLAALCLL